MNTWTKEKWRMTFLMQLCRAIRPMKWLSKPFVQSVFYARARPGRVYKVTKVQEFTGSKSHGIKIKNGGCYQPPCRSCVYLARVSHRGWPFIYYFFLLLVLVRALRATIPTQYLYHCNICCMQMFLVQSLIFRDYCVRGSVLLLRAHAYL